MNLTTEHNSDYDKNFDDVGKRLMKTMFKFRDGKISGKELISDFAINFGDARKQLMQTINQFRDGEISGEELMARVANANAVTDKIMREIKAKKRFLLAGKNS